MTLESLLVFVPVSLLLILAPGPDNILVLTRGITLGRHAAMVSAVGIVCHSLLAAAGLSAIVQQSATAFASIKYIGAAYLLFRGFRSLRSHNETVLAQAEPTSIGPVRIFAQGVLTNVLNPKVALFFLAYLPQFATARTGHLALELMALGLAFAILAWAILIALAWFSGLAGDWLRQRPEMALLLDRLTGVVFIGLGLRLALSKRG